MGYNKIARGFFFNFPVKKNSQLTGTTLEDKVYKGISAIEQKSVSYKSAQIVQSKMSLEFNHRES